MLNLLTKSRTKLFSQTVFQKYFIEFCKKSDKFPKEFSKWNFLPQLFRFF